MIRHVIVTVLAGFTIVACSSSRGFLEVCTTDRDCEAPMRCLPSSACMGAMPSLRCSTSCSTNADCAPLAKVKRQDFIVPPITCDDHCDGSKACDATILF